MSLRRARYGPGIGTLVGLLVLTACTSSNSPSRATDAPATARPASPSPRRSPSPARTTSRSTGGALNITRTCADIAQISRLNAQFNSVRNLAAGVALTQQLKQAADMLLLNIVDDISSDAHTYDAALAVVVPYVDRATSEAELASEVKRDGTLSTALSQMTMAESNLVGWHAANC